jgi:hypothetical protein
MSICQDSFVNGEMTKSLEACCRGLTGVLGSGGKAARFRIIDTKMQVCGLLANRFTPEKAPHYPRNRRLDGLQSQSGCCGKEKPHFSILIIEHRFLGPPARKLDPVPSELIQLPIKTYVLHGLQNYRLN